VVDSPSPPNDSTGPHVIRCAECHELVPADRVRHREERINVAAAPRPGRWRSGGPPIFRPTYKIPSPKPEAWPPDAASQRSARPRHGYEMERIPVCIDCLRRQRMGVLGVCGITAVCLLAGLIVYSRDETLRGGNQVALFAPATPTMGEPVDKPTPAPPVTPPVAAPPVAPQPTPPAAAAAPDPVPSTSVQPAPAPAPQLAQTQNSPAAADQTTGEAAALAAPPVWTNERIAPPRKAAAAPRRPPAANAQALRNNGYAELEHRRYPEALSLLQQATLLGDAYAPLYIGQLFENGIGVARDVGQASYWYGIAINRGNGVALSAFNRMRMNPY
jgi:hypothetical protein